MVAESVFISGEATKSLAESLSGPEHEKKHVEIRRKDMRRNAWLIKYRVGKQSVRLKDGANIRKF